MWKRWGTIPDQAGRYTSGFEEEYEESVNRRKKTGAPEISLYFKEVSEEQLADPGDELKKVLKFQKRIIDEQIVLFEKFSDIKEFEQKIRRCITRYIQNLIEAELGKEQKEDNKSYTSSKNDSQSTGEEQSISSIENTLTLEGADFVREFISKAENEGDKERITSVDVARFRLLSDIIKQSENDVRPVGVHDANILFGYRYELNLSRREIGGLVTSGLQNYTSENTPLWYWLTAADAFNLGWLQYRGQYGATSVRIGSLAAMELISEPLDFENQKAREKWIEIILSESTPGRIKVAGLGYLAECGILSDLHLIEAEAKRGNYETTSSAIDAILRINLHYSQTKAINALFEHQPEKVATGLLKNLFQESATISTKTLSKGVGHRSPAVRRIVARLLTWSPCFLRS